MSDPKKAAVSVARENDPDWVLQWGCCPPVLAVGTAVGAEGNLTILHAGSCPAPEQESREIGEREIRLGQKIKRRLLFASWNL